MSGRAARIGLAAELDERAAAVEHYQGLAAEVAYPRLLAALVDLYEGRGCKAVEGSARMVVAAALGLEYTAALPDIDLVWERLPSGEFGWLKADLTIGDRRP